MNCHYSNQLQAPTSPVSLQLRAHLPQGDVWPGLHEAPGHVRLQGGEGGGGEAAEPAVALQLLRVGPGGLQLQPDVPGDGDLHASAPQRRARGHVQSLQVFGG